MKNESQNSEFNMRYVNISYILNSNIVKIDIWNKNISYILKKYHNKLKNHSW